MSLTTRRARSNPGGQCLICGKGCGRAVNQGVEIKSLKVSIEGRPRPFSSADRVFEEHYNVPCSSRPNKG